MKAQGEGHREVEGREATDRCGKPDGRDGNPTGGDAESPRGVNGPDRLGHCGEVSQRFAHAHEDQVAESRSARKTTESPGLLDDSSAGEVAIESTETARTETATDRATHLARNATGAAAFGRDHHAFSLPRRLVIQDRKRALARGVVRIGPPEEDLAGAIGCDRMRELNAFSKAKMF